MTSINFTSTYQVKLTQPGVNTAKREKFVNYLVDNYQNRKISKTNTGTVKVSMPEKQDDIFERDMKQIGFKIFQKFPAHNVKENNLEHTIAEFIRNNDFVQKGKQKKKNK